MKRIKYQKYISKMSNKNKDVDIKTGNTSFLTILSIYKILIQVILK